MTTVHPSPFLTTLIIPLFFSPISPFPHILISLQPSFRYPSFLSHIHPRNNNAVGRLILIPSEHPQEPCRQVPLSPSRNEEKRESAWRDIEIIVSKNADKRHLNQIDKIVAFFRDKYLKSYDINRKIAGLETMPSLIYGLKNCPEGIAKFAQPIVTATLDCLGDG